MHGDDERPQPPMETLTAAIVAAYVRNNVVPATGLVELISGVHLALLRTNLPPSRNLPVKDGKQKPAVSIRKSVTTDFIICLEDGKAFQSLKRHLRAKYGMTPDEYRAKWGLPVDYPMVSPAYAAKRSDLARSNGLGKVRKKA